MAAKYEKVLMHLSEQISAMSPGDQLPTEQQLAEQFSVSNMTVRRALDVLSNAKRIVGVRGRGIFVAQPAVIKQMTLASFTDSMKSAGMSASAEVLSMGQHRSDSTTAERLGLEAGKPVLTIDRLRFGDQTPLCIDRSVLPAERFPGLLGLDLSGSLYEILSRKYDVDISRSESRISAVLPSADDAALLQMDQMMPCIRVAAVGIAGDGQTVESTVSLYRGDRYELLVSPTA